MSIRIDEMGTIRLENICGVADAEQLLVALQACEGGIVDISGVTRLHMAVAQLLAIVRPRLVGAPEDDFLQSMLLPALQNLGQKEAGLDVAGL